MPTMRKEKNLALIGIPKNTNDGRWCRNTPADMVAGGQLGLPMMILETDQSWREHAVCKTSDLDFVPRSKHHSPEDEAACKAVCAVCPVTEECLQWALEADDKFAICGGYTYKERLKLKR